MGARRALPARGGRPPSKRRYPGAEYGAVSVSGEPGVLYLPPVERLDAIRGKLKELYICLGDGLYRPVYLNGLYLKPSLYVRLVEPAGVLYEGVVPARAHGKDYLLYRLFDA